MMMMMGGSRPLPDPKNRKTPGRQNSLARWYVFLKKAIFFRPGGPLGPSRNPKIKNCWAAKTHERAGTSLLKNLHFSVLEAPGPSRIPKIENCWAGKTFIGDFSRLNENHPSTKKKEAIFLFFDDFLQRS